MKRLWVAALLAALLAAGCEDGSGPQAVRDAIAADYGWIVTAQAQHRDSCQADPAQAKCRLISRAIAAHNAAIDAFHLWCEGPPAEGTAPYAEGGPCSPRAGLEPRLRAAVRDLDRIVADVKELAR